jgi:hypothetical protein
VNAGNTVGGAERRPFRLLLIALVALSAPPLLGAPCGVLPPTPPPSSPADDPPAISVTLNAVPDDLNDLMIVPQSGFVVNVSWEATEFDIDESTLAVSLENAAGQAIDVSAAMTMLEGSAVGVAPDMYPLPPGSYTARVFIADVEGNIGSDDLPFAVRISIPPIGHGQHIWYDFEVDRDAVPGPDFAVDLEFFGLASSAAPQLSALVRDEIELAVLDRVSLAYHDENPNQLPYGDPVDVTFTLDDPAVPDTTRICVGGADPSGQGLIGSILIDPNNWLRDSVECGTIPPTGIFPRGLLGYSSNTLFKNRFDPLRPAAGGTPVGEHPLDVIVLDAGFDPQLASAEERARAKLIDWALYAFADALGTIVAHETGHALGLVPPGPPGGGLYGGQDGLSYSHNTMPDGSAPGEPFLMNSGNTFSFKTLAGLLVQPLPWLRPLNFAYLRDRAVLDPRITEILPPPTIVGITPSEITSSLQTLTIDGGGLVSTPTIELLNDEWSYVMLGAQLISDSQMTALAVKSQILPGVYDVVLTNPDGQSAILPGAVLVP